MAAQRWYQAQPQTRQIPAMTRYAERPEDAQATAILEGWWPDQVILSLKPAGEMVGWSAQM